MSSSFPGSEACFHEAHRRERWLERRLQSARHGSGAARQCTEPLSYTRTAGEMLGMSSGGVYNDQYSRATYSARLPSRHSSTQYMMQW